MEETIQVINFRSLLPAYERPSVVHDLAGLRAIGCNDDLVDNLCPPGYDEFTPLARPEDWFWTDRRSFGAGGPWLNDLYEIAGGCFADLSAAEQCKLLGLDVDEIYLRRAPGGRGKWLNSEGSAVNVEAAALDALLLTNEVGFCMEGDLLGALRIMVLRITHHRLQRGYDIDQAIGRRAPTEEHIQEVIASLELLLDGAERLIPSIWPKMNGALRNVTVDDLLLYVRRMPTGLIRHIFEVYVRYRVGGSGHPDLTIVGGHVRFIEVKVKDRLWGSQARWINDVARPLGLRVSLVRIVEA